MGVVTRRGWETVSTPEHPQTDCSTTCCNTHWPGSSIEIACRLNSTLGPFHGGLRHHSVWRLAAGTLEKAVTLQRSLCLCCAASPECFRAVKIVKASLPKLRHLQAAVQPNSGYCRLKWRLHLRLKDTEQSNIFVECRGRGISSQHHYELRISVVVAKS